MRKGSEAEKILNSMQIHEGKTTSVQDRRHRGSANHTGGGTRGKECVQDEIYTQLRAIVLLNSEYTQVRAEISSNRSN